MGIYIALLAGCVALGVPLCSSKCGKWGKAVYCIAAALAFVIISSLRFEVGYDYLLYAGEFSNMKYWDLSDLSAERMEKGFLFPLYILSLAFENYETVFIYTSLVFYPVIFLLIYKYSSKPWISTAAFLCLGIFFNSLCFLRQFMAALIVLYAVKYIGENRPVRYLVLILAASVFHWSALLMTIMYIFLKIKPGYIYLAVAAVGTVVFCLFSRQMMFWFIDTFPMYKGYNPDTSVEASSGTNPMYAIMFTAVFLLSFLFRKRLAEKNPDNSIYINCLMFTAIFEIMGAKHAVLSRFALLVYLPPVLYLIPDLVSVIKEFIDEKLENGGKKVAVNVLSAVAGSIGAAACYAVLLMNNSSGVVPYVTILNKPHEIFEEREITDSASDESFNEDWYVDESDVYFEDDEWAEEEWEDEEIVIDLDDELLAQLE